MKRITVLLLCLALSSLGLAVVTAGASASHSRPKAHVASYCLWQSQGHPLWIRTGRSQGDPTVDYVPYTYGFTATCSPYQGWLTIVPTSGYNYKYGYVNATYAKFIR